MSPVSSRRRTLPIASIALGTMALVAACTGSAGTAATAAATDAPAATTAVDASAAPAASSATTRVSANTASQGELIAALTAAGVPNAERWAREIQEYRPYDASDTGLTKLQQNLAKYQPSAETLAGILSVLQP